jgi:hypothetical protein
MKFLYLTVVLVFLALAAAGGKLRADEYLIMGGYGPPAKAPAPSAADVAVCTQTDSSGKVLRTWTEPASIVRAAHGWTAATPASQCTGCVECQCPAGDCASGKCPAATRPVAAQSGAGAPSIGSGCPNGNCGYPAPTATQWRGQSYARNSLM